MEDQRSCCRHVRAMLGGYARPCVLIACHLPSGSRALQPYSHLHPGQVFRGSLASSSCPLALIIFSFSLFISVPYVRFPLALIDKEPEITFA